MNAAQTMTDGAVEKGTASRSPDGPPKPGFRFILDEVVERVGRDMNLRDAMHRIISLGDRIELDLALDSLTPRQASMLALCGDFPVCSDAMTQLSNIGSHVRWYLGIWNHGRIWLADAPPSDTECREIAWLDLTPAQADAVSERAVRIQGSWEDLDSELDAFYSERSEQELAEALYLVHEAVDQTDPVLLYIGDETLTNFAKFNNLQARSSADLPDCFFTRVRRMQLTDWTRAERIFVFCFYWLRIAGCRGEEFNARQLNPVSLSTYLDKRLAEFRSIMPALGDAPAVTIADKARTLARYRVESADAVLVYRWVNGLTFYKEERLCARRDLPAVGGVPDALESYISESLGIQSRDYESLQVLFDEIVERMAQSAFASDTPNMNAFERFLERIVSAAIAATDSDVGMTRGFRDIERWEKAFTAKAYDDICGWPGHDYYCAVFPSDPFFRALCHTPETLIKVLYACSGRMQFNSWHYTPGHCPRESVPPDRHFYIPPRMSDTAVWSDQHHAGHVLAQVRYSIRSPAPITVGGRVYPGLVDLRLFRQQGRPFTDAELFRALPYTECIRASYQALADYIARTGTPVRIEAFGKEWFKEHYAALCRSASASIAGAKPQSGDTVARSSTTTGGCLTELFGILYRHASLEKVAIVEARHERADVAVSYRDLIGHALALRAQFAACGLQSGETVAVLSDKPVHQAIGIIAGLANAIVVHPVNPALSHAMLDGQLRHARPALLIVDDGLELPGDIRDGSVQGMRMVPWSGVFEQHPSYDPAIAEVALKAIDPEPDARAGLLIYTSGTTGDAKGVLLTLHGILTNVRYAIGALGYEPGWISGSLLPRFHTFTLISDLLPAILLGGRTVVVDTFEVSRAKSIAEAFKRHEVRSYSAAPIILEVCSALRAWREVPSLRFAVSGAAPLNERTRVAYQALFGHPIIPCYGLTESTCFASISPPAAVRSGSAGRAAGIELAVVSASGKPLEVGETGEIALRGASVVRGYHNDQGERFRECFTSEGWFLTGDVGHLDADGFVYITGRKKNMVIRGGEKVYLEDLDRCLFEHVGVVDCASIVRSSPSAPDEALTFIVTADSSPLPRADIEALVRRMLTPRHVPDRIYFVEWIPRTASGKPAHRHLLELATNDSAEVPR